MVTLLHLHLKSQLFVSSYFKNLVTKLLFNIVIYESVVFSEFSFGVIVANLTTKSSLWPTSHANLWSTLSIKIHGPAGPVRSKCKDTRLVSQFKHSTGCPSGNLGPLAA